MKKKKTSPPGGLLTALRDLAWLDKPEARTLAAWSLLTSVPDDGELDVGLDYAIGHNLLPADMAAPMRLQHVARVTHRAWRNPTDGLEMIWIPAGPARITRGKLRVELPGFSLARHPVTNAQYAAFVEATSYTPPADHPDPDDHLAHWRDGSFAPGEAQHPVVFVSYLDALHYGLWAGLTLPGEWHWEKAARGPDGSLYPWGDARPTPELACLRAESTVPVGSYPRTRTAYGCEDMLGNVSDWVRPGSRDYDHFPLDRPSLDIVPGDKAEAAVRGGAFMRNINKQTVLEHRRNLSAFRRNRWVGFRPALMPRVP